MLDSFCMGSWRGSGVYGATTWAEFVSLGKPSTMVYRLHMSLYGLKQSPQTWFHRFGT